MNQIIMLEDRLYDYNSERGFRAEPDGQMSKRFGQGLSADGK
jgi:hypothetical protein